jgi:hypothetical protein
VTEGDEALSEAVEGMYRALSAGDMDWFEDRLAADPGATQIGAGAAWCDNRATLLVTLEQQAGEMPAEWRTGGPVIQELGDVAWVADRPILAFDEGSVLQGRVTLVWVRERGRWCLAHSHLSLGAL